MTAPIRQAMFMKGVASAYATFDGVPSGGVTLSNGNLTVTTTNPASNLGGRSASVRTTGKYYFEVVGTGTRTGEYTCGVLTSSGTYTNAGVGVNSFSVYANGNIFFDHPTTGATLAGNIGAVAAGDVVGVAIDLDNRRGWGRKNNGNWNASGTANPTTNIGGALLLPTVSFGPHVTFGAGGNFPGDTFTGNFGASAFVGAVPAGFTPGWPA